MEQHGDVLAEEGFWKLLCLLLPMCVTLLTLCPSLLEWLMMISCMEGEDLCVRFWQWK